MNKGGLRRRFDMQVQVFSDLLAEDFLPRLSAALLPKAGSAPLYFRLGAHANGVIYCRLCRPPTSEKDPPLVSLVVEEERSPGRGVFHERTITPRQALSMLYGSHGQGLVCDDVCIGRPSPGQLFVHLLLTFKQKAYETDHSGSTFIIEYDGYIRMLIAKYETLPPLYGGYRDVYFLEGTVLRPVLRYYCSSFARFVSRLRIGWFG